MEDGGFLTEDTYRGEKDDPDTQNLYGYCSGDPVNYVDPSGHGRENRMVENVGKLRACTDGNIKNKYGIGVIENRNNGDYAAWKMKIKSVTAYVTIRS